MPDIRLENLIPNEQRTPEERRKNARKAGIASGEARREKKRMSQIYADFLASKHKITIDDTEKELEGVALLTEVMKKVLSRGDSASVSLLKELREATEGSKLQLTGDEGGPVKFEIVDPKKTDADTPRD